MSTKVEFFASNRSIILLKVIMKVLVLLIDLENVDINTYFIFINRIPSRFHVKDYIFSVIFNPFLKIDLKQIKIVYGYGNYCNG